MVSGVSLVVVLACVSSTGALSSGCGRALPVNVTLGKQKLHELPLLDPDSRWVIGHGGTNGKMSYLGDLDELRIYDRALTATEITRLADASVSPRSVIPTKGLVASWSLTPPDPGHGLRDAALTRAAAAGGRGRGRRGWRREGGWREGIAAARERRGVITLVCGSVFLTAKK